MIIKLKNLRKSSLFIIREIKLNLLKIDNRTLNCITLRVL